MNPTPSATPVLPPPNQPPHHKRKRKKKRKPQEHQAAQVQHHVRPQVPPPIPKVSMKYPEAKQPQVKKRSPWWKRIFWPPSWFR